MEDPNPVELIYRLRSPLISDREWVAAQIATTVTYNAVRQHPLYRKSPDIYHWIEFDLQIISDNSTPRSSDNKSCEFVILLHTRHHQLIGELEHCQRCFCFISTDDPITSFNKICDALASHQIIREAVERLVHNEYKGYFKKLSKKMMRKINETVQFI